MARLMPTVQNNIANSLKVTPTLQDQLISQTLLKLATADVVKRQLDKAAKLSGAAQAVGIFSAAATLLQDQKRRNIIAGLVHDLQNRLGGKLPIVDDVVREFGKRKLQGLEGSISAQSENLNNENNVQATINPTSGISVPNRTNTKDLLNRASETLGGDFTREAVGKRVASGAMKRFASDFEKQGLLKTGLKEAGEYLPEDLQVPGSLRSVASNAFGRKKAAEVAEKRNVTHKAKTAAIAGAISSVAKGELKPKEIASTAANWAVLAIAFGTIWVPPWITSVIAVLYLHLHWYLGAKHTKFLFLEFQPFTLMQKIIVGAIDAVAFMVLLGGLVMFVFMACVSGIGADGCSAFISK